MAKKSKALAKRPVGRPKIELDPGFVRRLAWIQCTDEEIAAVMQCSVDTLTRNFAEILKTGRLMGKSSLRRHQWRAAAKGNPALLIWLGKQLLGQREKMPDDFGEESVAEMLLTMQRERGFADQHPPLADDDKNGKPN